VFRGAGWNVIKVIWGSRWDALLAKDVDGVLLDRMNTTVDGEYQKLAVESGAYIREHFFGPDPRLRKLVEDLTDDELVSLPRGGHDYRKLYAAYKLATEQKGAPTVILAKTIKGWTLGPEIEARNATHQIKKMTKAQQRTLRDRLYLTDDIPDAALEAGEPPYIRPAEGSDAMEYLRARGRVLDGPLPVRSVRPAPALRPDDKVFEEFAAGSGKQSVSTTMVFARLLRNLVRDPTVGALIAPIVSDEARTFGLEPLIAEAKIYAPDGQNYVPVDADLPLKYAESSSGQVLQEGITEAGALSSFIALATSYATWGQPMLPVYLFYSMFGFQRVGDLAWALGDMRGRGVLAGCTAGRTTLMGEGLQHDDGQSPLLASTNPAAMVYDASFAYEVAVIMEEAVAEVVGAEPKDRFWYLTLYNETYLMPALPKGDEGTAIRKGIIDGAYRYAAAPDTPGDLRASLCFSGPMWSVAVEAQQILAERYGVGADLWAVTSWANLRSNALEVERWNRLHPDAEPRQAYISSLLGQSIDPVVTITDYMRSVPDQVARFVERPYTSLGTDGFGRSDARDALRSYFEVDASHLVVAVLEQLARQHRVDAATVRTAIDEAGIDPERVAPFTV
jgi:pyruvate dehydrogenase E1 component